MTKEIPPLYRPTDLPPPYQRTVEKIRDDGTIKRREVWVYCAEDTMRQQYALELLRKARVSSKYSVGGQPGMRLMHNVVPHIRALRRGGERAFYLLDLEKAYPSVDRVEAGYRFYKLIGRNGMTLTSFEMDYLDAYMHEEVGAFLSVDGIAEPGVPQGNATSGAMLDVILNEADYGIGRWLNNGGGVYTRFIDDLSFSVPASNLTGKFPDATRHSIRSTFSEIPGVTLNNGKTQNLSANKPVTITGITFTADGLLAPSPGILKHAKACFDATSELLQSGGEVTKHDVNVFDGYRGALAIAGPPDRSSSQEVRTLYNRAIGLGNRLHAVAAEQGVISPREPLVHAAAQRRQKTYRPKAGRSTGVASNESSDIASVEVSSSPASVGEGVLADEISWFAEQPTLFDVFPEV